MNNFLTRIKCQLLLRLLKYRNKKQNYDISYIETYRLPPNAPDHYNNSFYFTGHEKDGHRFLARLAFRGDNSVEVWFSLLIPGKGLFNYTKNVHIVKERIELSAGPLTFRCLEPAKKWSIIFTGEVESDTEKADLSFKGIFSSNMPIFNFSKDINPLPLARSLSQEKWSRTLFKQLKAADQVHTEQCGQFEGQYSVNQSDPVKISMKAVRDHSFGPRDWGFMLHHMWFVVALEDGSFFNFSLVDYPILKNLATGFWMDSNGNIKARVISGPKTDELWQKNEAESIPQELNFQVEMDNGAIVKVSYSFEHSITWSLSNVYSITEGLANYTVNDIEGQGIAEFGTKINGKERSDDE